MVDGVYVKSGTLYVAGGFHGNSVDVSGTVSVATEVFPGARMIVNSSDPNAYFDSNNSSIASVLLRADLATKQHGHLYIGGLPQDNIKSPVSIQYKKPKHSDGGYQQLSLPFYN